MIERNSETPLPVPDLGRIPYFGTRWPLDRKTFRNIVTEKPVPLEQGVHPLIST
jgi:hypothetical protein